MATRIELVNGDTKKSTPRNGLIALNVMLLVVFAAVSFVPESVAQTTPAGNYIAVPAKVNGVTSGVVYIMDTTQQELVAVTWDHNNNRIAPLGYRNIKTDTTSASRN